MSSNGQAGYGSLIPVSVLMYRDVAVAGWVIPVHDGDNPRRDAGQGGLSADEMERLLAEARTQAVAETVERLHNEMELSLAEERAKIRQALEQFKVEQRGYFAQVESDVVQLALAIVAKILHREAQVDPLLIAALVRIAVEKLHDGSSVCVHVSEGEGERWSTALASPVNGCTVDVVEDKHLKRGDCILQTDLGSTNFSMDAQLKEVEQGFFDLLAQRPTVK